MLEITKVLNTPLCHNLFLNMNHMIYIYIYMLIKGILRDFIFFINHNMSWGICLENNLEILGS